MVHVSSTSSNTRSRLRLLNCKRTRCEAVPLSSQTTAAGIGKGSVNWQQRAPAGRRASCGPLGLLRHGTEDPNHKDQGHADPYHP